MTALFIITTISQAVVPIYAQDQTATSSSHLSKVVDYQKAIESTSSVNSVLANSNKKQALDESQKAAEEKLKKSAKSTNLTKVDAIQAGDIDDGIPASSWRIGAAAGMGFKAFPQKPTEGVDYIFGSMISDR